LSGSRCDAAASWATPALLTRSHQRSDRSHRFSRIGIVPTQRYDWRCISVHVVSLHSINDREIANKYASHFDAVLRHVKEALSRALTEMLQPAQKWPEVRCAAMPTEESETLSLARRGEACELPGATYWD
jgi:hypothetical protein